MATKNNPGKFDCYADAHPDEPMFILRGGDEHAPALVRQWIEKRRAAAERMGPGPARDIEEKLSEAEACAVAMEAWNRKMGLRMWEQHDALLIDR